MSSDGGLVSWLRNVNWAEYIEDSEVHECATKLQKRIQVLMEGKGKSAGDPSETGKSSEHELADAEVDMKNSKRMKLVVVGDGAVGKTSLLITFKTGEFPTKYVPTVFQNYSSTTELKGKKIFLQLWDTAGQEDYDRLRPLSYPGSHVVLLVFSLVSQASYNSIRDKWYPEVNHYAPGVPLLLIGNKYDLRAEGAVDPNTKKVNPVTPEQGEAMAKEIGARQYIEVSAKTNYNLDHVFQQAITTVFDLEDGDGTIVTSGKSKKIVYCCKKRVLHT